MELSPGEVELPRGITARVQDVQPRELTVALDVTGRRLVAVHPVVRLAREAGYAEGRVTVVPGTVRLLGPADRIRRIDSLETLPLEVAARTARSSRRSLWTRPGWGPRFGCNRCR